MNPIGLKVLQCFLKVREVHHYYWTYTTADDANGKVSIENLQRIVERLTRKKIKMDLVDFDAKSTLAEIETFDDRFEIHVREQVPSPDWHRMGAVNEFWHALSSIAEDMSADGVKTIRDTVVNTRGKINWETLSPQARAEKLAETFMTELLYPIEYRTSDMERHAQGVSFEEIGLERGVPPHIVETALDKDNYEYCMSWWKSLDGNRNYPPLEPFDGEVS